MSNRVLTVLPPKLRQLVEIESKIEGISKSKVICEAVKNYFANNPEKVAECKKYRDY